jgi:predicted aspartyl protease
MLIGRFGNTTGAPYLEASVTLPRIGVRGLVSFLVDTGADITMLMPSDARKLAVDYKNLRNPTVSQGVGGTARGFTEIAIVSFSDGRFLYSYELKAEIAKPTPHNLGFPSLLGRDVLKRWRSVINNRRVVTFTPLTWDLRQRI